MPDVPHPQPGWARRSGCATRPPCMTMPDGRLQSHGVLMDVTAQTAAEEAVRASEEQQRQIIETASSAYVAMDGEGICHRTGTSVRPRRSGDPRHEAIGRAARGAHHPRGKPRGPRNRPPAVRDDRVRSVDRSPDRSDGAEPEPAGASRSSSRSGRSGPRQPALQRADPRHHRASATRGRAPTPGIPQFTHGARQSRVVHRSPRPRAPAA